MTSHRCTVKRVRLHVFERRKIQCSTLIQFLNLNLVIKTPYLRKFQKSGKKVSEIIGTQYCYTSLFCNCDCYCFRNTIWNYFSTAQGYLDRQLLLVSTLGMSIPSFLVLFYLLGYLGLSYKIHSFKYDGEFV
jgi:hypothetical protein